MTINHLNLIVTDVAAAVGFFETYFGFTCKGVKGDNVVAILKNEEDFTLVLMADKNGPPGYPDAFHIGFMVKSTDEVNGLYEKLKNGGVLLGSEPKKIRDSFGFYFTFDTVMIEVGHYMD